MTDPPDDPSPRIPALAGLVPTPRRADARRNVERLLAAADDAFTQRGPNASLDEIARRAGVGNATLYRHFPTRQTLLVAVCVNEVESLCARGAALSETEPPGDALTKWLHAFIEHVTAKRGLAAALMTERDASTIIAACNAAIATTGASLLRNAQDVGAVRSNVDVDDLLRLVNAIAAATEPGSPTRAQRMLALVLDGIRSDQVE